MGMPENTFPTLVLFGSTGIGLVWGWWCVMRFRESRRDNLNWISVLAMTGSLSALSLWQAGLVYSLFLLLAAVCSALLAHLWLKNLETQYRQI